MMSPSIPFRQTCLLNRLRLSMSQLVAIPPDVFTMGGGHKLSRIVEHAAGGVFIAG